MVLQEGIFKILHKKIKKEDRTIWELQQKWTDGFCSKTSEWDF